jgi:hypothetical protein
LVLRARYDVLILELVALTDSPMLRKLTFVPAELEDALTIRSHGIRRRQRRLQKARRMLEGKDTNQVATSVAFVCGFNDVGHFSRES